MGTKYSKKRSDISDLREQLKCNQLHIFKVCNLVSFGICIYLQHYYANADNKYFQNKKKVYFCPFVILWFIIRNIDLTFVLISDTKLLKPLEFSQKSNRGVFSSLNHWSLCQWGDFCKASRKPQFEVLLPWELKWN